MSDSGLFFQFCEYLGFILARYIGVKRNVIFILNYFAGIKDAYAEGCDQLAVAKLSYVRREFIDEENQPTIGNDN